MKTRHPIRHTRPSQRGSAITEFALVAPLLLLLFFGSIGIGGMLDRSVQATSVARDLAHMYVEGVDFTQSANQNIAFQLASGTGMTASSGKGVVIFSRVMTVYQGDCDAAGYGGNCANLGQCVFAQRIVLGNSSLRSSAFGTPAADLLDAQGNINPGVYLRNSNPSVVTSGLSPLLTSAGFTNLIPQGESVWITEVFFAYPDISYLGPGNSGGAYARFIF